MDKKRSPAQIYAIVILILLAILLSILFKAHENYSIYEEQKGYFNQPNPEIQDWMSIKIISDNFNLSSQEIFKELNLNETKINSHVSLYRLCRETHQDCVILVEKLNNIARK